MIPKTINYCWFGGKPLPESVKKCINSWKKYCPTYEIKQWNETNFDVNCSNYTKEAYKAGKWAFVSDYARFWILYKYGGIYLDTDVEIIKPLDKLISNGPYMGCEKNYYSYNKNDKLKLEVNSGLGMAAKPGMSFYKKVLDLYKKQHFYNNGKINYETVVTKVTKLLSKEGFKGNGSVQKIAGIIIYPPEYFCPKNYLTGEITITPNTYSIHHYTASWFSNLEKIIYKIEKNKFGPNSVDYKLRRIISFPFRALNRIVKMLRSGF